MQPTLLLNKSKQMGRFVNFLKCSESIKSTRRQIILNQMEQLKGISGPFTKWSKNIIKPDKRNGMIMYLIMIMMIMYPRAYNCMVHSTTGETPFYLAMEREPMFPYNQLVEENESERN